MGNYVLVTIHCYITICCSSDKRLFKPKGIQDMTGLFLEKLIETLSIYEDEYISFKDTEVKKQKQNVDYREFRARPFI